jgi:hypothetical protein
MKGLLFETVICAFWVLGTRRSRSARRHVRNVIAGHEGPFKGGAENSVPENIRSEPEFEGAGLTWVHSRASLLISGKILTLGQPLASGVTKGLTEDVRGWTRMLPDLELIAGNRGSERRYSYFSLE